MWKETAWDWIGQNEAHMIEVSNKIWESAELGLQEFKSAALIADTLEEFRFEVKLTSH